MNSLLIEAEFDRSAEAPVILHYYPAPAGAGAGAGPEAVLMLLFYTEAQKLAVRQELLVRQNLLVGQKLLF